MDARDKIIWKLANRACNRISRRVIRTLQKMTEGMQSGNDSRLKNIWDEVCVQVQGQESMMWEAYLDTMRGVIVRALPQVDLEAKQAIWLQTSNGLDWEANEESEDAPVDDDDIAEYILNEYVRSAATDWTNSRIEKYKANPLEID